MFTNINQRLVMVRGHTVIHATRNTAIVAKNAKPTLKMIMAYTMFTAANLIQETTTMATAKMTPRVTARPHLPTEMACRTPP